MIPDLHGVVMSLVGLTLVALGGLAVVGLSIAWLVVGRRTAGRSRLRAAMPGTLVPLAAAAVLFVLLAADLKDFDEESLPIGLTALVVGAVVATVRAYRVPTPSPSQSPAAREPPPSVRVGTRALIIVAFISALIGALAAYAMHRDNPLPYHCPVHTSNETSTPGTCMACGRALTRW